MENCTVEYNHNGYCYTKGIKYECDIQHIDKNTLVASWDTAINGKLIIG